MPSDPTYSVVSSLNVPEAAGRLEEAARALGYTVTGGHDLQASLAKGGFDRPAYVVVEVCKPAVAHAVLSALPRAGSMMPCAVAVYDTGGATELSAVMPSSLMGLFGDSALAEHAAAIDADLRAMIDAVNG